MTVNEHDNTAGGSAAGANNSAWPAAHLAHFPNIPAADSANAARPDQAAAERNPAGSVNYHLGFSAGDSAAAAASARCVNGAHSGADSRPPARNDYIYAILAMCAAVTISNILVQYPFRYLGLGNILTYGAFTYPFAFLVNDITNRRFGRFMARRVVYAGFIAGLAVSWFLAGPRLAVASGAAFLFAQLLDIWVFTPLRRRSWWQAPLCAAICGSCLDTVLFFSIAFAASFSFIDALAGQADSSITAMTQIFGLNAPVWLSLALGDFCVKLTMAFIMLAPYRAVLAYFMPNLYGFKLRS